MRKQLFVLVTLPFFIYGLSQSQPRILLTNDDGIDAPGLVTMHKALSRVGRVTVAAPATNQSGASHGLTTGYNQRRFDPPPQELAVKCAQRLKTIAGPIVPRLDCSGRMNVVWRAENSMIDKTKEA